MADMPFHSYENPDQALTHATQLKEAGAKGVKLEGGQEVAPQIQAILQSGIPCVGHLGMLPQRVVEEGGYRIKGAVNGKRLPSRKRRAFDKAGSLCPGA